MVQDKSFGVVGFRLIQIASGAMFKEIQARIFSDGFIQARFSAPPKADAPPLPQAWRRVLIRPVMLRGELHWQFSYFDAQKDITKNYLRLEAGQKLQEVLDYGFRSMMVETRSERLELQIAPNGKITRRATAMKSPPQDEAALAHDRVKEKLIGPDNAAPFLQAVEIVTANGQVRAGMQAKLRQINEFVRLVDETGAFDALETPLRVVDFGSGKGYLTFALYFYLTQLRHMPADLTGVDLKAEVLNKLNQRAQRLGWDGLRFVTGSISDYRAEPPPQVVVALHACDTATDDALAKGLAWGSRLLVTAPCCQHHLQAQMAGLPTPAPFEAVSRHGILFERLGDILTDGLRAAYLRVWGYRTEVIQFVSAEHTSKNLMIRAVLTHPGIDQRARREYEALKAYWNVTPYLETLYPLPGA